MIDKEAIYDEKIAPLMSELIRICKENDIPMVADFQLTDGEAEGDEDGSPLYCTTAVPTAWASEKMTDLVKVAHEGYGVVPPFVLATITTQKG